MRRAVPALVAASFLALSAPAGAGVRVQAVDTSAFPLVRLTVVTDAPSRLPPVVRENGAPAAGQQAENLGRAKSVVLGVDRSQSMAGRPLREAVAAARAFVAAKPAVDRIAVATFATQALMLTGFSSSTIDADTALRSISVDPVQGTRLYDGLVLAARRLASEELPSRVVIVVTDGNETASKAGLADVVASARKARVSIYVVGIESSRFNPAPLRTLAARTGGRYYGAASAKALRSVYGTIARELRRTWRVEYLSGVLPGERAALSVAVPGQGSTTTSVSLPEGASRASAGGSSALPPEVYQSWGVALLAFTVGALVLLAYGFAFSTPGGERLRAQLAAHVQRRPSRPAQRKERRSPRESLAGILQATERAFGHTRLWARLGRLIERAALPLKTAELVYLMLGSGFALGIVFALAGASSILILFALAAGLFLPLVFVWWKARRRLAAFENQLPDILLSVAASLKAGHSFKQGLQGVVDEGHDPAGKEFKRVLAETRLGRPLEDALQDMAERLGSKNLAFIVTAVSVQSQVGGSLASLFDMVAETVRNRQQFARKIKALTAMGRMSAYVLVGLPFLVGGAIGVMNPDYMAPLFHSSAGHKLLLLGLTMMAVGSLILKKIVSFKG